MKTLLAFFGAVVLSFTMMGVCLGWFGVAGYENNSGVHRISVDINPIKIVSDYLIAKQRLAETIAKFQEESSPQQPRTVTGEVADRDALEKAPTLELPRKDSKP